MTSHWHFVAAAYAVTAAGTLVLLLHSWLRMRRAEGRADGMRAKGGVER